MSINELGRVLNISPEKIKKCMTKVEDEYPYNYKYIIDVVLEVAREKIPILPFDIILYEIISRLKFCDILNIGMVCKEYNSKWKGWITTLPAFVTTNVSYYYIKEIDDATLSTFHSLTTLDLSGRSTPIPFKSILSIPSLRSLNLSNTKIKDVSALGKFHTLDLSTTRVEDVSALGHVHTLNLANTKVENVSALGNVYVLNLSNTLVEDVSALGNVYSLNLSDTMVNDISALVHGRIHTLIVEDLIVDLSPLTSSHINTLIVSKDMKIPTALLKIIPNIIVGADEEEQLLMMGW